jgi:hypothetical protein
MKKLDLVACANFFIHFIWGLASMAHHNWWWVAAIASFMLFNVAIVIWDMCSEDVYVEDTSTHVIGAEAIKKVGTKMREKK